MQAALNFPFRSCRCLLLAVFVFHCFWSASTALAASTPANDRVLTTIREIRALSPEAADLGPAVNVHGIVTRATPYELFIQDGADAIFVWMRAAHPECQMGDYVEITGITNSGHLSPLIKADTIRVLEHRALPTAHRTHYYELASGREDCQWTEAEGIVRTIEDSMHDLTLRVSFDGMALQVVVREWKGLVPPQLIGAHIRLRGVVGGSKTPQRQMVEPVLWVTCLPETFQIIAPGPADIFSVPLQSANSLLEYGRNSSSGDMARVRGVVTGRFSPNLLFLREGAKSLEIRLQQSSIPLKIGDQIEVVGFPEMSTIQPILKNSFVRFLAHGPAPIPHRTEAKNLLNFAREADWVEIQGELREIFHRDTGITLVVSEDGMVFSVDLDIIPGKDEVILPPVGSRVSLTGICQIDHLSPPNMSQVVAPASFHLRLHSLADLRVLTRPTWWTTQRLLTTVALLSAFALGALGLIWSLDRRVRSQTEIILRNGQNEAMLEERNRIARELHDTLEQQLAGATILLDAIATILIEQPERARDGLNTARAMLRHSLDEAQHAVSDLRNNDLFERDLKELIEDSVRERLQHTSIAVDFHYEGAWPDLTTVVKKNILRIVQESVTNAIKHAAPTRISIVLLAAHDRIELHVVDDGCGFSVQNRKRRGPGEFGLIGLHERAEKIGAKLSIQSAPQRGTTVAVSLSRKGISLT